MQITKVQVSSILRPNDGNKDVHDIQSPNGLSVGVIITLTYFVDMPAFTIIAENVIYFHTA